MAEEKKSWEKFSDKGLNVYKFFALTILLIVIIGIIITNQFTLGIKIIMLVGVLIIAIISYFLYELWHKYFYEKFFKKAVYKMEKYASKPKQPATQKLTFLKISSAILIFDLVVLIGIFGRLFDISRLGIVFVLWLFGNPIIILAGLVLTIFSLLKDDVGIKYRIIQIFLLVVYIILLLLSLLYLGFMLNFT